MLKRLALMTALLLLACFPAVGEDADMTVEITALNVGKADAILVRADERLYLIDAGTKKGFVRLEEALNALNVTRLDGVFLTHTDKDHGGGLEKLAKTDIAIDAFYAPTLFYEKKPEKHQAAKAAKARGMEVVWLNEGDVIDIAPDCRFVVMGPQVLDTACENNNSLVMKLVTPEGTALFTGDMEFEAEARLLNSTYDLDADCLKVAHHGRDDATSPAFAQAVSPQIAIISTDSEEEPRSPAYSVLDALEQTGARVCVTQDYDIGARVRLIDGRAVMAEID